MSTPEFEVHRAIVHSSNPVTGEAQVRIPALLGAGHVVSIPTTGLTNSDGFWNVPSVGSSVFIAVSHCRTHYLWLTAVGLAGSGGDDPSNEPIGHEDRTGSLIAFDNATRTFSIQPAADSYVVWCVGLRYEKTSLESIQIPNTTGLYYISFNSQGQLQYSTDYFVWDQDCPTAYVYWNSTTQRAEFFADERHGITMDWQTHEYLHRTRGAAYANGFDASNFVVGGDGSDDSHAKIDIDNGTFFDEDLQVDVRHSLAPVQNTWEQQLQGPARIPVFYRFGVEGWRFDDPTDFPVKKDVFNTHPTYNGTIITAGGAFWDAVELGANSYGIQWIVATNQLNYPILSIMGQTQYANVGQAEAASWADMDLDGLPIVEIRVLYKIIFRATGTNTPGCYFEQVDDYRNALSNATSTAAAVVDHGNLTGLADDDHPQYALADGSRGAGFDHGNLTGLADDDHPQYLLKSGGTLTGELVVDVNTVNRMRLYTEQGTAQIADTFADASTFKSYIYFDAGTSSNDPGYIMHETSDSETNEGVLHLCPSDDNSYGDYVSIHGTNDPDKVRIHTDGTVEGLNNVSCNQLTSNQLTSGLITANSAVYVSTALSTTSVPYRVSDTNRIAGSMGTTAVWSSLYGGLVKSLSTRSSKNNIEDIGDSLSPAMIDAIELFTWVYKDDTTKTTRVSPMADDVAEISPLLAIPEPDENGNAVPADLDMKGLLSLAILCIQDLRKRVADLEDS